LRRGAKTDLAGEARIAIRHAAGGGLMMGMNIFEPVLFTQLHNDVLVGIAHDGENVSNVFSRNGDGERLSGICAEVTERRVADVRLHDVLKSHDPIVTAAVAAITREAQQQALGSALYVEAAATQLAVHLLRNYAAATFHEPSGKGNCRFHRSFGRTPHA
jgi:hypothetical protein